MRAEVGPPRGYLIALALALVFALLQLPYAYYQLLRLLTCGLAAWSAIAFWRCGRKGWAATWLVLAAVYNPVFPLYLGRASWTIVNLVSAGFVITSVVASHLARQGRVWGQGGVRRLPPAREGH